MSGFKHKRKRPFPGWRSGPTDAISQEEALLARIDRERTESLRRLEALHRELQSRERTADNNRMTSTEKVVLFKCGSCPNQAFTPVSDHVIMEHLKGRFVAGVYPGAIRTVAGKNCGSF